MRILNGEEKSSQFAGEKKKKRPVRPVISGSSVDHVLLKHICPVNAIGINPVRIDLGKCVFCGNCADAFPAKIQFSTDANLSTNVRDRLILIEGEDAPILPDLHLIRENNHTLTAPVKLKIIGNDEHDEVTSHDFVQFVISPAEAQGLIFTEEIRPDMEETIKRFYEALLPPKLIILAGAKAISGGVFDGQKSAVSFMNKYRVDLYIPGDAADPLTIAHAMKELISSENKKNNESK
jgi:Ni,Fe-hydrogenase III small subunit